MQNVHSAESIDYFLYWSTDLKKKNTCQRINTNAYYKFPELKGVLFQLKTQMHSVHNNIRYWKMMMEPTNVCILFDKSLEIYQLFTENIDEFELMLIN